MQANLSSERQTLGDAERGIVELLLEALPAAALLVGADGRIAAVNRQAQVILGWTAMSLEGQSAHDLMHCVAEDFHDSAEPCPIARILQGEKPEPMARLWIRCHGDGRKPIEYRCTPYPTGKGFGAIFAFNDISQQLDNEKDLRSLVAIAEDSPVAIAVLNADANLMHANPMMMTLIDHLGTGSNIRPAVLPENIEALTAQCLTTQQCINGIEVRAGDRLYVWKLVPVANQPIVRGYGVDVTPRH